jgi:hypothetical protein
MSDVKITAGAQVRRNARLMLEALADAATRSRGVMSSKMPGVSGMDRQTAARWLRQMGVPIYARRKAGDSAWFLLLEEDVTLASEWSRRMLADCYSETCRAHMALRPHPQFEATCRELAAHAVTIGGWLGYGLDRVVADLAPTPKPKWVEATIASVVVTE